MDEGEFTLVTHDVAHRLDGVLRDLGEMLSRPDLTDDQSEHVEDLMGRIGDARSIMAG